MEKKQNVFKTIFRSIKNLFIHLFGFGKAKKEMSVLREEELMSPTKQILKKFVRNRVAIIGFVMFAMIVIFVAVGSQTITFDAAYTENSQQFLQPGTNYLNIPNELKRTGIKKVTTLMNEEEYLVGNGVAFSVAVSKNNKIFVWGANPKNVKDVPQSIRDRASEIVQMSVGANHIIVLFANGEITGWGNNSFEQTQIPIYNDATDSSFQQQKKTIQAYFLPEARLLYPDSVVTTIETDPIKKIVAGYEYTSILTEQGRVYTWGNTNATDISLPRFSFNYSEVEIRVTTAALEWRYAHQLTWTSISTVEELIAEFGLVIVDGDPIRFRVSSGNLQWKYTEAETWETLRTVASIKEELAPMTDNKIVDISGFEFNMVYYLEKGQTPIIGLSSIITTRAPAILTQTSAERGYDIIKLSATKSNCFALLEDGTIIGWGESNAENRINQIPEILNGKNIVNIVTGLYHIVALDDAGQLYTWGAKNNLNQLDMPTNIANSDFITANYFNSLSVTENGSVSIWGNRGYIFGTDFVGADLFKRVIAGGSMTMVVAAVAVLVSLVIGLVVGLTAGFYGKGIDNTLMRFGEIVSAFPFLPLAMTLAKVVDEYGLGEKERIFMIMVILGLLSWPGLARLIRGQILSEREKDFVMAAKALGIKEKHVITRHILPNVINVVIVSTTLSYAGALLTESGLSFLGFGVRYPQPSWGNILTSAQSMTVLRNYWWLWIIPAFFIIMTALSINLVGDGLREAMDPKSNER